MSENIQEKPLIPDEASFEPQARVLYATALARSLNYVFKRDYLENISVSVAVGNEGSFTFLKEDTVYDNPVWLKVEQVGLPVNDTYRICFEALQRILLFCSHQSQVLFLVTYDDNRYHIYLGIRTMHTGDVGPRSFVSFLGEFSQSLWNGLSCKAVASNPESASPIRRLTEKKGDFDKVIALTGIPSNDSEQEDSYPLTIDYLLKSLRGKNVAYLVCADPVQPETIEHALFEIREAQGQMESLKTMSLQHSSSYSQTHTDCENWSQTHSKKDLEKISKGIMSFLENNLGSKAAKAINSTFKVVGGAGAAALAGEVVAGAANAADFSAAISGWPMASIAIAGLLSSLFIGSVSEQKGGSRSDALTTGSSDTLGQSIVNKHAESVAKQLDIYARRYELGRATGMWNTGVYLLGDSKDVENAAYQLAAIISGKSSKYEPIRKHDITYTLDPEANDILHLPQLYAAVGNRIFLHPIGKMNSEIKTVLTTRELTAYINFPLQSVDGINAVPTTPDFSLRPAAVSGTGEELVIGSLLNGGNKTEMKCVLDLRTLCKHSLVCGINGSGKTNTILNILSEIKQRGKPFLIIEPAKSEYVDWAFQYNQGREESDRIRILMPGRESYAAPVGENGTRVQTPISDKLRFNPFEVLDLGFGNPADRQNKVLSHIGLVKTMFGLAFPMQDILPTVLELLIYKLYSNAESNGKVHYPTLSSMLMTCEGDFISNLGYDVKNTMIIQGALKTRVRSLLKGWKKDMLNNIDSRKNVDWADFFSRPTVLNLSAVGDDSDKSFIMGLVLLFLFEYWQSRSEDPGFVFSENNLNHLLVIEEAHRIMTASVNPDSPLYKVGRFFTNFLTEMRAYGQGMMIVDQVPSRLIPDAISNTNLKIVHKLVSGTDIESLAVSMGLSGSQKQMISRLSTGQCIISGINSNKVGPMSDDDIYWCLVNKKK